MWTRTIVVWCGLLVLAFVNGAVREATLVPVFGDNVAHAISSVTLSAAIIVLARLTIGWIAPASSAAAWQVGALWLALTLAFEFLAGHYLFGTPWSRVLADYNVLRGRIWIVVLLTTVCAPGVCRKTGSARSKKAEATLTSTV
jgi:hypothetical protein